MARDFIKFLRSKASPQNKVKLWTRRDLSGNTLFFATINSNDYSFDYNLRHVVSSTLRGHPDVQILFGNE
jgi:hypothetical protein